MTRMSAFMFSSAVSAKIRRFQHVKTDEKTRWFCLLEKR